MSPTVPATPLSGTQLTLMECKLLTWQQMQASSSPCINHANGSVTLSLPLNQPLLEKAVILNMTKYSTVPTNRSGVTGNIVTEMVTWGTSTVFCELELARWDTLELRSALLIDDACICLYYLFGETREWWRWLKSLCTKAYTYMCTHMFYTIYTRVLVIYMLLLHYYVCNILVYTYSLLI